MKIAFIFVFISGALIVGNGRVKCVVDFSGNATVAKEGDIPYIALIEVRHPHTGRFMPICAGAIISEYDVLTSAMCASSCQYPPNCRLYVGRYLINTGGIQVRNNKTVWHPTYNEMDTMKSINDPASLESIVDLGIIHTAKIPLSQSIQIIKLATRVVIEDETAIIAGWGSEINPALFNGENPKQNEILKYGEINVRKCVIWKPYNRKGVCATGRSSIVRSAISDMGAPMIYPKTVELAGMGNFRHISAPYAEHDIFFDVYAYSDWIQNNMLGNSTD